MNNKEIKEDFIEALFDRDGIFTSRVSDDEIRTRCPFCGDSKKSSNTGHLYLKINLDDNSPIIYHCFLCEEGGVLQPSMLELLDIDIPELKSNMQILNKTSDKFDRKGLVNEIKMTNFDFHLPNTIRIGRKTKYIEDRLGISLSVDDFKKMKVITSLRDFCIDNKINYLTCPSNFANMLERDYVGFLSFGSSHILFRDVTGKNKYRWVKYPITNSSNQNRIFYSMEASIDIFTKSTIKINLAEGVFDILSANYNLGFNTENCLNICVSGRYYDSIILLLVSMGFIGSNIELNIFADNDRMFNNKNVKANKNTDIGYYKKILKNYKYLFGKTTVYYNTISKDIGVPKDRISLKKYII